jgi:GAF domain-containing protein
MVGVAMDSTERKQADDALQQQFQRERLISAIAGRIHHSLNLKEILNTTVAEVRQFLECDRVIIFRLHEDGSGKVVVESVGCDWMPLSGTVIYDGYFAQRYIQLYQQGRVQAVENIYTADLTACHRDLLAQFQVRANLVVPIVHEERLWGLLVAQQCSGTRQWQPLEIDLLKSLSTQAAIAIQQSELYQQAQTEILQRQQAEDALQQQFQRERLVGAIAGRIRKSLKLEKILNATVAEVRQVLQTDRVIIFRFEPDWSGNVSVESVTSKEFSILGQKIYDPCFQAAFIQLYQQGRVKAIEDIYTAHLSPCHIELLEKLQVRSNLIVPILQSEPTRQNSKSKNQNQLWGLLIAHHCSSSRQWQQWEMDLLSALASQAAIAIYQSQLYEQAQSLAKREQALNQVTQAIRSSLDLETIFATTVQKIGELLQVERAHILQYRPERKVWLNVCEYRQSPDSLTTLGREIPDEPNGITESLKRLEIVKIHDTDTCEYPINKNLARTFPGAWLVVPLYFNASVWGSLGLIKEEHPYYWQDYEVELICAVADQVAIAIQQAELYQKSRTATAQARTQAQKLEQALIELQKTQAHLVQTEKMSSLGQLVAGVAHEINNPVSFIYGNLTHASGYTHDLLGLVELYQQHYPQPAARIQEEIEVIDLEFLMEDMPKLLSSMKVGAERICEIVAALRTFSRVAEADMKAIDLHEGLDSTLMILQNRLKASGKHPEIQVIKEYGLLPKVECYAGQLNQVFMNLLVNAIDAIDEYNQKRSPEEIQANPSFIRVHTELLNENEIAIRIADNGLGMTPVVQARLFDPFFTTKPVGAGTGLGLSISYQIVVEKHGGKFYCCSELGKGTEFVIQIPLSQGAS